MSSHIRLLLALVVSSGGRRIPSDPGKGEPLQLQKHEASFSEVETPVETRVIPVEVGVVPIHFHFGDTTVIPGRAELQADDNAPGQKFSPPWRPGERVNVASVVIGNEHLRLWKTSVDGEMLHSSTLPLQEANQDTMVYEQLHKKVRELSNNVNHWGELVGFVGDDLPNGAGDFLLASFCYTPTPGADWRPATKRPFESVWIHLFKEGKRPYNSHNIAMVYIIAPDGREYAESELGDYKKELAVSSKDIIKAVELYNQQAKQKKRGVFRGTNLPLIELLRLPAAGAGKFKNEKVTLGEFRRHLFDGLFSPPSTFGWEYLPKCIELSNWWPHDEGQKCDMMEVVETADMKIAREWDYVLPIDGILVRGACLPSKGSLPEQEPDQKKKAIFHAWSQGAGFKNACQSSGDFGR